MSEAMKRAPKTLRRHVREALDNALKATGLKRLVNQRVIDHLRGHLAYELARRVLEGKTFEVEYYRADALRCHKARAERAEEALRKIVGSATLSQVGPDDESWYEIPREDLESARAVLRDANPNT